MDQIHRLLSDEILITNGWPIEYTMFFMCIEKKTFPLKHLYVFCHYYLTVMIRIDD